MTYTITRERVTWCQGYDRSGRPKVTHPTVWTVAEGGVDVRSFTTKRDAVEWVAAQS